MALRGTLVNNSDNRSLDSGNDHKSEGHVSIRRNTESVCPSCGKQVPIGSKFCYACGTKLVDNEKSNTNPLYESNKEDNQNKSNIKRTSVEGISNKETATIKTISGAGNAIAATRKKLGAVLAILGIIVAVAGGAAAAQVSKQYEPVETQSGYIDPNTGELVITDTGKIGGNYEAVSYFSSLEFFFIIGGILIFGMGAGLYSSGINYEKTKSVKREGQVVGVDTFGASIEFNDGSRARIPYLPRVVLICGDKGVFEMKENTIIGFDKQI